MVTSLKRINLVVLKEGQLTFISQKSVRLLVKHIGTHEDWQIRCQEELQVA